MDWIVGASELFMKAGVLSPEFIRLRNWIVLETLQARASQIQGILLATVLKIHVE